MMKQEEIKEFFNRMSAPDMVKKVEFPAFDVPAGRDKMKVSISFIDDIQVTITAELGESTMKIREILKLAEGAIIELDQPAGENAQVFVNNQRIGTGEIVVIGGNFGIRMDSVCQTERKEGLSK